MAGTLHRLTPLAAGLIVSIRSVTARAVTQRDGKRSNPYQETGHADFDWFHYEYSGHAALS